MDQQVPQPQSSAGIEVEVDPVYKVAQEIFLANQRAFAGDGIPVRSVSDCADTLLLRSGAQKTPELRDALRDEIREALNKGRLVAERGHYRLVRERDRPHKGRI